MDPELQTVLDNLKKTVEQIRSSIDEIEQKDVQDYADRLRLRKLKNFAYDAEDAIADFEYELLRREVEEDRGEFDWGKWMARAGQIVGRYKEQEKQWKALKLRESDGKTRRTEEVSGAKLPSGSIPAEKKIFGRDDDIKTFVNRILAAASKAAVFPIVGAPGTGKTTFAQHLYRDPRVEEHFQKRMGWVWVPQDSKAEGLACAIYESITKMSCLCSDLWSVQENLKGILDGGRFLIVLDNVWCENRGIWDSFWTPLASALEGSVVVIVTRNYGVIKALPENIMPEIPLVLTCLKDRESLSLFSWRILGDPDKFNIPNKFLSKCRGLPWAVKAAADTLSRAYDTKGTFDEVLQGDLWDNINHQGASSADLASSYRGLRPPLKRCVAYCSLFPQGYKFNKDHIVRLWIAEGFIETKDSKKREEVGSEYFEKLLEHSFFLISGELYVMPNPVGTLLQSISEYCRLEGDGFSRAQSSDVHHLSFVLEDCNTEIQWPGLAVAKALRSFLVISVPTDGRARVNSCALQKMEYLRTLDLSDTGLEELPQSMDNLKHLCFLGLRNTKIKMLPNFICRLYKLQTLELSGSNLEEVPESIGNLQHLYFLGLRETKIKSLPKSICKLENLQKLDLSSSTVQELPESICVLSNLQILDLNCSSLRKLPESIGDLKFLKDLGLRETEVELLPESICKLYNLQVLELTSSNIQELPESIGNLSLLQLLMLSGTEIKLLPDSLCELSNLKTLDASCTNIQRLPEAIGNLELLHKLHLSVTDIKLLPDSVCRLANLQILELKYCSMLEELPKDIKYLKNLQVLDVDICMPIGIGELTELRIPPTFSVGRADGYAGIRELGNLIKLRELCISGLCNVTNTHDCYAANLKNKSFLEKLTLIWTAKKVDLDYEEPYDDDFWDLSDEEDREEVNLKEEQESHVTRISLDMSIKQSDGSNNGHTIVDYQSNIKSCNSILMESDKFDADGAESTQRTEHDEEVIKSLMPHDNLKKLTIKSFDGIVFPEWMGSSTLTNLTHVTLEDCKQCNNLPSFGILPHLTYLSINQMPIMNIGPEFHCNSEVKISFPSLDELHFKNMSEWEVWSAVRRSDFPKLKQITFFNCPKLGEIPCFARLDALTMENCGVKTLPKLPSLKTLYLTACAGLMTLPTFKLLEALTVMYCQRLGSLPELPTLKILWVEDCEQLTSIDLLDRFQFHGTVFVTNCPRLSLSSVKNLPTSFDIQRLKFWLKDQKKSETSHTLEGDFM